jgi:pyocin large subunit-like protein
MRTIVASCAAAALALGLAGCGGHTSAVSQQGGQSAQAPAADAYGSNSNYTSGSGGGGTGGYANRDAATPLVDGKPMWAANRRHSATENAQYQFSRNGQDFGAKTETDYVTKVHAFVENPPSGAETIDRPNGDKLIYDAKSNVFAVVSRDGAPRTMFKPRDGSTYWNEQKQRENDRASGQGSTQGAPAT